ncbi:MAG: DMT family transporter [Lachnospiraceae bacterium]|nr:DMT family transporter [Lachnospiraceae bacterium]MDY4971037.1 DMT family transporter [Lachnospiraceae bacterium]
MWGLILAMLSGALMSIQGVFNTEVTKQSGIWTAAGFVQFTAFLYCAAAWLLSGREKGIGAVFQTEPKYMLLGGIMGALITYTVIRSMDNLGPAMAVMVIVITQLLTAYLIEVFGLFGVEKSGFEWKKAVGAAVAIVGIWLFKR